MSDSLSVCGDSPRIEPTFEADTPQKAEPPRLELLPYVAEPGRARRGSKAIVWSSAIAAALALVAGVAAATLYDHAREANLFAANSEEARSLAQSVKALRERVDAIETARSREDAADARKVAAEVKTQAVAAHDIAASLGQTNARLDKLERDHSARLDKLTDRLDHETAGKFADLGGKLAELSGHIDKLEKHTATVALPTPASPAVKPNFAPGAISNETTGAIMRPPLRGYWLVEADESSAVIDGRDGPQQIAPGDVVPGVGRVQRIERRGGGWIVVTSAGVIAGDPPY